MGEYYTKFVYLMTGFDVGDQLREKKNDATAHASSFSAVPRASPWASQACEPALCPSRRGRNRTSTRRPRDAPDAKRSGRLSEANPVGAARGRADHAVEPVVVVRVGAHLPLVHLAAASLGLDAVLGGEMLGEEHVPIRLAPPEREVPSVAHRGEEAARHKRLPVVRVEHDMPDGPLAAYVRHPPVVSDAVVDHGGLRVIGEQSVRHTSCLYRIDFNMASTSSMLGCRHVSQSSSGISYSKYSHSGDGAYSDFTQ